jgi:phospholipid transport system substrate-binding protein
MKLNSVLIRLIILFLAFSRICEAAPLSEPGTVVDRLHGSLLETMKKAHELGYSGRYKTLDPVVSGVFDFPMVSRLVIGRHWKGLTESQRTSFIDTFTKLSIATYAYRFDSFSNEEFRQVAEDKLKQERTLVKTELKKSDGDVVRLDYVLQLKDSHWLIVNVIADGVSDLSLKRADYSAILKEKGYDALLAMLNDKITQYEKQGEEKP